MRRYQSFAILELFRRTVPLAVLLGGLVQPAAAQPADTGLQAGMAYRCAAPMALTGLGILVFKAFPGLSAIDAGVWNGTGRTAV